MPEASGSRYTPYPQSIPYPQQQNSHSQQQQQSQHHHHSQQTPHENNNNNSNNNNNNIGTLINSPPSKNAKGEIIGVGEKKDKVRRGSKACIGVSTYLY